MLASIVDEREKVDVVFVLERVQGDLGREVAAPARSAGERARRAVAFAQDSLDEVSKLRQFPGMDA